MALFPALRLTPMVMIVVAIGCSESAPPDPAVASIALSVADTGTWLRFREPLVVRATPQAALGVPLQRAVTWTSVTPKVLSVQTFNANGDSARIRPVGTGEGQVRLTAGTATRTLQLRVLDTVYSVTVSPGSLALVAGDTASFTATVSGPPNADHTVRWDVINSSLLQPLPSPDPFVQRVQARGAGTASVRATALADTTKSATGAVSGQVGKLVFLTQPATTYPRIEFASPVTVAVQNSLGQVSARAANNVTVNVIPGTCGAQATGVTAVEASQGIAVFTGLAVNARCPAATLEAIASPAAVSATSAPFAVAPRDCGVVVPFSASDTVNAVLESTDCVVMRSGQPVNVHLYTWRIEDGDPTPVLRLFAQAGFAPRVDAYLWPEDASKVWTDSLSDQGELLASYALRAGSYRIVVSSTAPGAQQTYSLQAGPNAGTPRTSCLIRTMPGVSFLNKLVTGCNFSFVSRPGTSLWGRTMVLYLAAGKSITVTMRPEVGTGILDSYVEAFDITGGLTTLIAFDDNSGGGTQGLDARVVIPAQPTSRFIEVRMASIRDAAESFRITITP